MESQVSKFCKALLLQPLSPRTEEDSCLRSSWQAWIPRALWPALPQADTLAPFPAVLPSCWVTHESSLFAGTRLPEGRPGWVSFRVAAERSRADWVTLGVNPWPRHPGLGECTGGRGVVVGWEGAVKTRRAWTLRSDKLPLFLSLLPSTKPLLCESHWANYWNTEIKDAALASESTDQWGDWQINVQWPTDRQTATCCQEGNTATQGAKAMEGRLQLGQPLRVNRKIQKLENKLG